MLTCLSTGGADILLKLYKKNLPAEDKKRYFIKNETILEVKYAIREVLLSFINL